MSEVWIIEGDGADGGDGAPSPGVVAARDAGAIRWAIELVAEPSDGDGGVQRAALAIGLPDGSGLRVHLDSDTVRARADTVELGERRWRESWPSVLDVVLYVARGDVHARVSDEDEPFDLAPGSALWLEDPPAGVEVDLVGRDADTQVVVVEVQRAE